MSHLTIEQIDFYIDHPVAFIEDFTGFELDPQQKDIINIIPKAIAEGKGVSVKAGHGVGKTFLEANIVLWFMATRPNCKVLCTANTQAQLYTILWSELSKIHNVHMLRDLFEWQKTKFYFKGHEETWVAHAKTSSKPEGLQGTHAEHLLVIVDEASGIEDEIFDVLEGTQTESGSLLMMFGNPTQISGGFKDSFYSKRAFYYNFTLSCLDSPRVKPSYGEKIAAKYGIDSNIYRVRVLGMFPKSDPDSIMSLDRIEKATQREIEIQGNILEVGCDVARFGSNETTIYFRIGNVIKLYKIRIGQDTMRTVGDIMMLVNDFPDYEIIINIDDSGIGGAVTDRLNELKKLNELDAQINPVNNGSKPRNKRKYRNRVSEMWIIFRDEFLDICQMPDDNDLIGQLSVRRYGILSSGQILIESKETMAKRKIASPDRADGVILTTNSLSAFIPLSNSSEEEEINVADAEKIVKDFRKSDIKDRIAHYKKMART